MDLTYSHAPGGGNIVETRGKEEEQSSCRLEEELERFANQEQLHAILDSGANPEDFLSDYETKLQVAESRAISDYIAEADNLLQLSVNMQTCDTILQSLEEVLNEYGTSLSAASSEIANLQRKSVEMMHTMERKKKLQLELGSFVEQIVLLPDVIHDIMQAPVNSDVFARALEVLDGKLCFVKDNEYVRHSAAYRDVAVEMERLRLAAVKRCRTFLMEKVYEMRQPNTNIQFQQNIMMKYRRMLVFLRLHGYSIYCEIQDGYMVTVTSKFLEVFKSYWASMEAMENIIVSPDLFLGSPIGSGVIGQGISSMVSYFSQSQKSVDGSLDDQHHVFELNGRMDILHHIDDSPIMPSAIVGDKKPFECLFASISRLLVDSAAHEYLFCKNFWQADGRRVFKKVFKPVIDFIHGSLNASLQEQNDLIALLLCIRINRENFLGMSKRRNPALDEHFDAVNLLLWPRVKYVLDQHLRSLNPSDFTGNEGLDVIAQRILPLTRRYASMMTSVLILNTKLVDGSISLNIEQLNQAVLNILLITSRKLGKRGEGTIFLLHNLHHVVSVLKKGRESIQEDPTCLPDAPLKSMDDVQESFEEAFSRALELYIESKIKSKVPRIHSMVHAGETALAKKKDPQQVVDSTVSVDIATSFSKDWKKVMHAIDADIRQDCGDVALCDLLQQTTHTTLLRLWSRFLDLMKHLGNDGENIIMQSISVPAIMQQMKT